MRFARLFLLVCASLLSAGAAHAHGDEIHGDNQGAAHATMQKHPAGTGSTSSSAVTLAEPRPGDTRPDDTTFEHERESETSFFGFLANLHPATVHFPVALFLMAALAELLVFLGKRSIEPSVRVLIYGGAAGAILATIFGWIHTGLWFGGSTVMQVHRWNGMLIAVLGVALVVLASRAGERRALLRTALLVMVTLILAQGFLGGELAHGSNHLGLSWI